MYEVWLRPNVRVMLLAIPPICAVALLGALVWTLLDGVIAGVVGGLLVALGAWLGFGVIMQLRRPRIAYRDGNVLFYLRARRPVEVPVGVVEAFFLGQGPAQLPGNAHGDAETVNLVARLSQKSPEWAHMEVKRVLGRWTDGYVTICGSWCEPLNSDVIRRLNRRLREVAQQSENPAG